MPWRYLFPLHQKCWIRLEEAPFIISKDLEDEVNAIWKKECQKRKSLFNGEIFSVVSISPHTITGRFIEYKYHIAGSISPSLRKRLGLKPALAVSGVTRSSNHILLGKRANTVYGHKGYFECVPSGSIDRSSIRNGKIDFVYQLKKEFEEESGLSSKTIRKLDILGLFYSPSSFVYDIGFAVQIDKKQVKPSSEYPELFWLTKEEMKQFVREKRKRIVPLSLALYHKAFS